MAAQGTGLPGIKGESVTGLVDFSGAAAPYVALADDMARTAKVVGQQTDQLVDAVSTQAAEADAAEQDFKRRPLWQPGSNAYNAAIRLAQTTQSETAMEADIERARLLNPYDTDGFEERLVSIREAHVAAAPGDIVLRLAQTFDRKAGAARLKVLGARSEKEFQEARGAVDARLSMLENRVITTVKAGGGLEGLETNAEVLEDIAEYGAVLQEAAENPAFALSPEEVTLRLRTMTLKAKAAAVTGEALFVLRNEGDDAALAYVQNIMADAESPIADDLEAKELAFDQARNAVAEEMNVGIQRESRQRQARAQAEQDMSRTLADGVATLASTGVWQAPDEAEIKAAVGERGYRQYLKERADALEEYRELGDLSMLTDDEAAAKIQAYRARRTAGTGLPPGIETDEQMDALAAAVRMVETGTNPARISADPDGAGPAGGGAVGAMQLLPGTAKAMAARLGVKYDERRLLTDEAYNESLGREYLRTLLDRYDGNTLLAVTAYHAGEGNVDGWIKRYGDPRTGEVGIDQWLDRVGAAGNPRSAAYPKKVAAAMGGGRADASFRKFEESRRLRRDDPAAAVAPQFPVQAAVKVWNDARATGKIAGTEGHNVVQAYLDAQERANIPQGQRQPLPKAVLKPYVDQAVNIMKSGDAAAFMDYQREIIRRFTPQDSRSGNGALVWQAVLEATGSDAMGARIATQIATGERPTQATVQTAQRNQARTRAANGSQAPAKPASQMSDAELRAKLAGLGGG